MFDTIRDGALRLLLNRVIIAALGAAGAFLASGFPPFYSAFCGG